MIRITKTLKYHFLKVGDHISCNNETELNNISSFYENSTSKMIEKFTFIINLLIK